jgi:hypothetical protein
VQQHRVAALHVAGAAAVEQVAVARLGTLSAIGTVSR